MTLNEYLQKEGELEATELVGDVEKKLHKVFADGFADEIFRAFKSLKIKEETRRDDIICTTQFDKNLIINPPVFYKFSKTEQVEYLCHEAIHAADAKGNSKVKMLSKRLWIFYNKHLAKGATVSDVMVGKHKVTKKFINKGETLSYLMNHNINYEYMTDNSKDELVSLLDRTRLLKMEDPFWKNRLGL